MPFIFRKSPKGGRPMREWTLWPSQVEETIKLTEEEHLTPEIVQDYFCWHIGYCSHCSQKLYIIKSVAHTLYKLLKKQFE